MKIRNAVRSMLLAAVTVGLASVALAKEEKKDQTVEWKDVPAAVQKTIMANANGGTVSKVEKETKKGKTVYEADVKGTNGSELEIKVAENGDLIKAKAEKAEKK